MSDDDDETEIDAAPPREIQLLREAKPPLYGGATRGPGAAPQPAAPPPVITRPPIGRPQMDTRARGRPGSIGRPARPAAPPPPAPHVNDSIDDEAKTRVAASSTLVPAELRGMSLEDTASTVDQGSRERAAAARVAPEPSFERTVRPYEALAKKISTFPPPRPVPSEAATIPRGSPAAPQLPDLDFSADDEPETLQEADDDDDGSTSVEGAAARRARGLREEARRAESAASSTDRRGQPAAAAGARSQAPIDLGGARARGSIDAPFDRHTGVASVRGPAPRAAAAPPSRAVAPAAARAAPVGLPSIVSTVLIFCLVLTLVGVAMLAYLHHRHMF